ncbi:Fungal Zn(2)-Cys(6) binuclear cluster domain-containing protein, partial [Penicillium ucsense]
MDIAEPRLGRKRESRTRAPTACQTCRLRKTRCDNSRPVCSYCSIQGVECIYPETSPHPTQGSFDSASNEILSRLGHITSLLEDIKKDGGSTLSSGRSIRSSFFEAKMQNESSPREDPRSGSSHLRTSTSGVEDRSDEHDPLKLYAANSPEHMIRWPVYDQVVTEAEKHIRSFLLDSLDSQQSSVIPPPRQLGAGLLLDDIQGLCHRYIQVIHPRNPVVDRDKLERYAKEVTLHGLGWDGPSCQVLLACALGCCSATNFAPPSEVHRNLDLMPRPPPSDNNLELAETYFNAAKQRFGSLHTSPTDISCFLLAGSFHRHMMRPLQAWFCFQQASCRLEVRLRSICRKQWAADTDYHNLESRLYWSCIQAEHEMQSELPLWSSGLENLGYSDPFPSKTNSTSPEDKMDEDHSSPVKTQNDLILSDTDESKGWILYIGSICNRRTVNDTLVDLWRDGERRWLSDAARVIRRTSDAIQVIEEWYNMTREQLVSSASQAKDFERVQWYLWGRRAISLEKIYRPVLYLACHIHLLPPETQENTAILQQIFMHAHNALTNCAEIIPYWWYQFRHEWIWNVMRSSFGAAVQIIAAVLSNFHACKPGWILEPPQNWPALMRMSIRTLKEWGAEAPDVELMRNILERMYEGTSRLVGRRPDSFST